MLYARVTQNLDKPADVPKPKIRPAEESFSDGGLQTEEDILEEKKTKYFRSDTFQVQQPSSQPVSNFPYAPPSSITPETPKEINFLDFNIHRREQNNMYSV